MKSTCLQYINNKIWKTLEMMNDCHTHNYIVTINKVHIGWLLFHITWNILSSEQKGGTENVINNFYSCFWRCT